MNILYGFLIVLIVVALLVVAGVISLPSGNDVIRFITPQKSSLDVYYSGIVIDGGELLHLASIILLLVVAAVLAYGAYLHHAWANDQQKQIDAYNRLMEQTDRYTRDQYAKWQAAVNDKK